VQRIRPKLGDKRTNWLLHDNNTTTSPGNFIFFTKTNMTVIPHPRAFLLPLLQIKLKGRHFDITEVSEAEPHVVLNTCTEHNFQDAFKKLQKCWKQYIRTEGDYFEGNGDQ
jgi:hypothetical protein